jgi:hypothetical protein
LTLNGIRTAGVERRLIVQPEDIVSPADDKGKQIN